MVARTRTALFKGVNCYVPAMSYAVDMIHGQPAPFSLGKPAASAISAISANAGSASALATIALAFEMDANFGRGLRIDLSGVPGNAPIIRLYGEDYLGQPISKDFTGSAAATTTTAGGLIMFKRVTGYRVVTAASNGGVNVQIGTLGTLGLPYKSNIAWAKEGNPPALIDPAGIFAKRALADQTDPQSLVTNDPRGSYAPTTLNGVNECILGLEGDNSVNASGNGGLHGLRSLFTT
jgi:hypothetical protein